MAGVSSTGLIDTKTAGDVVVDHTNSLHVRVANDRTHEGEPQAFQILAEPVRNR
jgi:hypothetical protein